MKQIHTYIFLFALAVLLPMGNKADAGYAGDCNRCYECSDNPINPCAFDVQVQAGIMPISWRHRGFVVGSNCDIVPPVAQFFQIPHFNDLYKLPWIVGGQIGYGLDCNTRLFVEFNYAQSRGKCPVVPTFSRTLGIAVSKYKLFDGYVGVRYYSDRTICYHTSFFMGAKIGVAHHKAVTFNATIISTTPFTPLVSETTSTSLFLRNTVFSGGGHIGADICLWGGLSLVITGEIVASCGLRGNSLIAISPAVLGVNGLLVSGAGTELRFPITAGLRYSF